MTRLLLLFLIGCSSNIPAKRDLSCGINMHPCKDMVIDGIIQKGGCCPLDTQCTSELPVDPFPGYCQAPKDE